MCIITEHPEDALTQNTQQWPTYPMVLQPETRAARFTAEPQGSEGVKAVCRRPSPIQMYTVPWSYHVLPMQALRHHARLVFDDTGLPIDTGLHRFTDCAQHRRGPWQQGFGPSKVQDQLVLLLLWSSSIVSRPMFTSHFHPHVHSSQWFLKVDSRGRCFCNLVGL